MIDEISYKLVKKIKEDWKNETKKQCQDGERFYQLNHFKLNYLEFTWFQ